VLLKVALTQKYITPSQGNTAQNETRSRLYPATAMALQGMTTMSLKPESADLKEARISE